MILNALALASPTDPSDELFWHRRVARMAFLRQKALETEKGALSRPLF